MRLQVKRLGEGSSPLNNHLILSGLRGGIPAPALTMKLTTSFVLSRQAALEELITCVLLPEFIPSGNNNDGQSKPNVSRDDLRLSRHKMAVALVEAYLAKLKNP
ncbi:unnamed protein product, partial [Trichobilharzia regenti]